MPTNLPSSWPLKQGPKKWSKHGCDKGTLTVANRTWDAQREKGMSWHSCSSCTTCAGSSEILRWLTPFLGPNMDPKMGSRIGSHFIPSFRSLLGPGFGDPDFGPKSGVSHRRILLLPAEVLQADLRRTSMSVNVNTCFFSLCVPLVFLYSSIIQFRARKPRFVLVPRNTGPLSSTEQKGKDCHDQGQAGTRG